jgi:hypothetical protein
MVSPSRRARSSRTWRTSSLGGGDTRARICVGSVAMTIAIVVGLIVVGIGLVLSQLFRLKDWLNRQPPPPPAEHPEHPEHPDAS